MSGYVIEVLQRDLEQVEHNIEYHERKIAEAETKVRLAQRALDSQREALEAVLAQRAELRDAIETTRGGTG